MCSEFEMRWIILIGFILATLETISAQRWKHVEERINIRVATLENLMLERLAAIETRLEDLQIAAGDSE